MCDWRTHQEASHDIGVLACVIGIHIKTMLVMLTLQCLHWCFHNIFKNNKLLEIFSNMFFSLPVYVLCTMDDTGMMAFQSIMVDFRGKYSGTVSTAVSTAINDHSLLAVNRHRTYAICDIWLTELKEVLVRKTVPSQWVTCVVHTNMTSLAIYNKMAAPIIPRVAWGNKVCCSFSDSAIKTIKYE